MLAISRVAGDAAATEAGGEVPAFCVHGALVSAVGARRAGICVVAENCSEKTQHTSEHVSGLWTRSWHMVRPALQNEFTSAGVGQGQEIAWDSMTQTITANGAKRGLRNHRGELF